MISHGYRLGRAIDAAGGSHMAGILLYRLAFMNTLPKVKFRGEDWVVNSNEDYQAHLRMSAWQLRDALDTLIEHDLIIREVHLFQKRTRPFIRLTEKAVDAFNKKSDPGSEENHKTGSEENHKTGSAENHKTYNKGVLEESSVIDISETSLATHAAGEISQKDTGEKDEMKSLKSVTELTEAFQAQNILHDPDKVLSVGKAWVLALKEASGGYVPPLIGKEIGQIKHLMNKCPPGKVVEVITFTVKHWTYFAKTAQGLNGKAIVPAEPNLGFLLSNANVAIKLALPKSPKKHEAKPAIAAAPTMHSTAYTPKPIEPKPTLAELLADPDEDL